METKKKMEEWKEVENERREKKAKRKNDGGRKKIDE